MPPLTPGCKELVKVGERIRTAREKRNVSLRQFSVEVGVTPSYFSKMERGEALAGTETYEKVCDLLELNPKEILPMLGLIDSETRELFELEYRKNAQNVHGLLRRMQKKG